MKEEESESYSDDELLSYLAEDLQANLRPLPHFELVVHMYQERLHRYANGIVRQNEDAEQVTIDALFYAHQALTTFSVERVLGLRLRSYLYRITCNAALRHLERDKQRKTREQPIDDIDPADLDRLIWSIGVDPEYHVEQREKYEAFKKAFQKLSKKMREALKLHFIHGLTYKEIAELLSTKEGNVKAMISRAREKLRRMLDDYFNN